MQSNEDVRLTICGCSETFGFRVSVSVSSATTIKQGNLTNEWVVPSSRNPMIMLLCAKGIGLVDWNPLVHNCISGDKNKNVALCWPDSYVWDASVDRQLNFRLDFPILHSPQSILFRGRFLYKIGKNIMVDIFLWQVKIIWRTVQLPKSPICMFFHVFLRIRFFHGYMQAFIWH